MIDLHLHLDGSLTPEDVKYLAYIQGVKLPEDFAKNLFVSSYCLSLNDYLRCFQIPLEVLQTEKTLEEATRRILDRLDKEGLIYVELRFAPQLHTKLGLTQELALQAVLKGRENTKIKSNIILCCMRNSRNSEVNVQTVDLVKKYLNKGVCGLDLAGAEGLYPTSLFKPLFEYASKLNVPFTIHSGEADGPKSIEDALNFGAKRIGHGVRAIQSEPLLKRLADEKIPLEVCMTSEIQTKAVKDISSHPLMELIKKGVKVLICTDDMAISQITMASELSLIKHKFWVSKDLTKELLNNSIDAAFISNDEKEALRKELNAKFDSWYLQNVK